MRNCTSDARCAAGPTEAAGHTAGHTAGRAADHGRNAETGGRTAKLPASKYLPFILPAVLTVLIILSIVFSITKPASLTFDFAVIPFIIGGGYVAWSTVRAVLALKKVTAGVLVTVALIGTVYVEEFLAGAIVGFMMVFGEFLENLTIEKTKNAIREIIRLVPQNCRKKVNGAWEIVPIREVRPGDYIQVIPGERVAVDGPIVAGQASLNQSSITGESMPVDKTVGDTVFVGSLNENGVIEVLCEKVGSDTVLGRIIKTVHQAQNNKGKAQRIADTFARFFLPVILVLSVIVWFLTYDLMRVMTILVIACPCALVLATPTAVIAAVGNAAKRGVLIKGGDALEIAAKVRTICFDKTGTITMGEPAVVDHELFNGSGRDELIYVIAIVEKNSQHPIGRAAMRFASENGRQASSIPDGEFEMLFGRGVRVTHAGKVYEVSNERALEGSGPVPPAAAAFISAQVNLGRTALLVIRDGDVLGGIAVADKIRPNIERTVRELEHIGIRRIVVLTGDNPVTARTICAEAGIPEFEASLLPEEKLKAISDMRERGEVVAMVGDGVNDAPALVLADVGIAMGAAGTDVAMEASSIALMSDKIEMLPATFALSRKTYRIIQQNIWVFAVFVNIIGVIVSGMGLLNPIMAAVVHNAASVFVVVNSSRLLSFKYVGKSGGL
ncbi:MAG TPA: cation-translocating P-type ATPase [Magnetospirillaceae bacterium]|nr:cation-translocating P-type ATPase [Magnetospirillaceae bacterium]